MALTFQEDRRARPRSGLLASGWWGGVFVGLACAVVGLTCAEAQIRTAGKTTPSGLIAVQPLHGRYCQAFGPQGWFVAAEDAERVGFGADFLSSDGLVAAGYSVGAAGALSHIPGHQTVDSAVAMNLTLGGRMRLNSARKVQTGPNSFLVEYVTDVAHGLASYRVFPAGRGSWIVVLRTASTGLATWPQRGAEAVAVARSLRCQVPNVPAEPAPPATRAEARREDGGGESGEKNREDDTLYNQWLDKEYYHNPRTGENFWVSPSQDWNQNGPQGPGYYAQHANEVIKLDPGYSQ